MNESFFIVAAQVNQECFAEMLPDSGCTTYDLIDSCFACKHQLKCISILPHAIKRYKDKSTKIIDEIIHISLDISSHYQHIIYLYMVPTLVAYDIILGLPWLEQQHADIILSQD